MFSLVRAGARSRRRGYHNGCGSLRWSFGVRGCDLATALEVERANAAGLRAELEAQRGAAGLLWWRHLLTTSPPAELRAWGSGRADPRYYAWLSNGDCRAGAGSRRAGRAEYARLDPRRAEARRERVAVLEVAR